ncbi:homeobox-containing protein 1-like isoform X1 [Gadus macrocephalus]|uniref:homeobox-containing protein 1-like isoform X1 n=1 Tax=Gadus macrocephalus TaxID=80720 RepID=UPI0028CB8980|nr:homeobox-containing protein 1-like isoform X1 [Gadus macrocephalus]
MQSARMSHPCEEPRFTIEQIDLLQRLWRSGMTQAEIVHALDTLERLERQHSRLPSPRSRPPPPRSSSSSTTSTATQTCFAGNGASPSPSNLYRTSPPLLASAPTPVSMAAAAAENGLVGMANGKLSPPRFPVAMIGSSGGVVAQSYGFETSEEDLEFEEKVEELMRMDSAVIKEEIKNFLGNRRISQAVVAQVTGISQSRISHWLVQQGSDLSDQKKRAFYRWYLLEKTNPGATLAMRPAPMAMDEMVEWHQTPPSFGSMPGGSRLRRGSRFTWRKECLSVMESYFSDNQYPDEAKREEIASACNAVIQKPGKKLSDLERVTSLKVYNWFANRRKEMKRRANIEAAILESHGMDVVSPGGHSNSDEVDGNDFPEQGSEVSVFDKRAANRAFGLSRIDLSSPTQVPSLLPSWLAAWPGLGRGGVTGQKGNPLIGRSLLGAGAQAEASRLTGVSWSPPSPSLQDEPTNHSSPTEVQDPISLAVEMAAVNHTILALANQASDGGAGGSTGNDIKTETMEDE